MGETKAKKEKYFPHQFYLCISFFKEIFKIIIVYIIYSISNYKDITFFELNSEIVHFYNKKRTSTSLNHAHDVSLINRPVHL